MKRALAIAMLAVLLAGCGTGSKTLVIGSKAFTEGEVLGYVELLLLQHAGYHVIDRIEMGPTLIVRQALLAGQVDSYIEYTGTALVNFFGIGDHSLLADPLESYRTVARLDAGRHDVVWLSPMALDDTYTVLMTESKAGMTGLSTLSQLAAYAAHHTFVLGVDPEFAARKDGLPGLLAAYHLHPSQIRQMDAGLVYSNLHAGRLDAAIGYSTDGRIAGFDLVRLSDDRHYFPSYHPAPLFRAQVLAAHPDIRQILDPVAPLLTDAVVTEMNYRMDVLQGNAEKVARDWLREKGLL